MKMRNPIFIGIMSLILIVIISLFFIKNSTSQTTTSVTPTTTNKSIQTIPQVTTIATGLEVPWALAFLPDGSLLVTERPGRVRLITKDGKLSQTPLLTLSVIQQHDGEGGLLGIALHPDFTANHYVYLYYTYAANGQESRNRVSRYTLINNKLVDEKIIVDDIPGALYHDGGRIKFGPDKLLYITTGDSEEPSHAQDTTSLAGKILRVTDDGKPVPDNPFNNDIFSYGHRNPEGITWDANGNLWETEHGRTDPSGFDEINLIESGKNYGWPTIQGSQTKAGMITPKRNSGETVTWAPADTTIINNTLFFTGLKGAALYAATIQDKQITNLKEYFTNRYGRLREVITGPDGMLYITTSNKDGRGTPKNGDDKILRVNPEKL